MTIIQFNKGSFKKVEAIKEEPNIDDKDGFGELEAKLDEAIGIGLNGDGEGNSRIILAFLDISFNSWLKNNYTGSDYASDFDRYCVEARNTVENSGAASSVYARREVMKKMPDDRLQGLLENHALMCLKPVDAYAFGSLLIEHEFSTRIVRMILKDTGLYLSDRLESSVEQEQVNPVRKVTDSLKPTYESVDNIVSLFPKK